MIDLSVSFTEHREDDTVLSCSVPDYGASNACATRGIRSTVGIATDVMAPSPPRMCDIIATLQTPEQCANLEANCIERGDNELALAARRRGVELRAEAYGATSAVERECLAAIYAYENVLLAKNGRATRATRTWNMVTRHGILEAAERAVDRKDATAGYTTLIKRGLENFTFEAVILRHPTQFSPQAVERARNRVNQQTAQ
jgi:hypothetical protein